ncbi:MAG TPA: aldehyde dehydrogenase family protein [Gemmatimonadota bacterium]
MKRYRNYVDGEWRDSVTGRRAPNVNPANTDDVLGELPLSTRGEAEVAIAAAEAALPAWRDTPAPERGRVIARAHRLMADRAEDLARALTREEGKILREARGEVQKTLNILEFVAGEGLRLSGDTMPSEIGHTFAYTVREPIGVVGAITPWNFPVAIPCWKIAPALVAGNTVVFKPASLTPETAEMVVSMFVEAGLPAGVLNLVFGSGSEVGAAIVEDPRVRAVSFTGSNDVGTALYARAAEEQKKVQCEMGGKNPILVLEDADLAMAVEATAQGAFGSTGQRCTATSRAILVDAIADEFVERLAERARDLVVGDGLDESVDMGPSVDESQFDTVLEYIGVGREEGAELVTGGEPLTGESHHKGYFIAPTIFDRVDRKSRIAQEEIFGPVLSVIRVADFEEGLAVCNDTRYGLTSSVYTQDASRVFRFVRGIETGITHVNSPTMGGEAQLPFGGTKATGVGMREMGKTAIDFYSEWKTVYIDYTGRKREGLFY